MARTLSLRQREQPLALAAAGTLLAVACVAPLAVLLVREGTSWPTALSLLAQGSSSRLLVRSLALSLVITAVALGIGLPAGVLIGRTDVRGGRPALLLHAFPMFVPPFLLALGWYRVWGAQGFLGSAAASRVFFGEIGLVAVMGLALAPVVTALVALGLRSIDPSLEEAARSIARPMRVVTRILLPSATPAIVLAALVVFALAFSELGVPMFLRVDTFPAAVFARLGGIAYAPGEALGLVLPALVLALVLVALERRLVGSRSYSVLGLRTGRPEPLPLGRWRGLATVGIWTMALASAAPVAVLAWGAFAGGGMTRVGPWLAGAPWVSLLTSALGATLIVAIGLVIGHAAARRFLGAAALDAASVLTFVAPAAVLGIGLMAQWNRPWLQGIYGTAAILVIGYVARYAVVGVRTIGVLVSQTPIHLEEAAAAAGAGFGRRLTRIVVPIHARGLVMAWLLALVFCLRDLELAVLFYPPGVQPLTVRIFTLEANGPAPAVAALATVHVAMTAAVLGAGTLLWRQRT